MLYGLWTVSYWLLLDLVFTGAAVLVGGCGMKEKICSTSILHFWLGFIVIDIAGSVDAMDFSV